MGQHTMINKEQRTKAVGNLTKMEAIKVNLLGIDEFFYPIKNDNLTLEEILFEWYEKYQDENIILFPINKYYSQIKLMIKDIPTIYEIHIDGIDYKFIFLKECSKLEINDLKNIEELSGIGQIITPFDLNFTDFSKKFEIKNSGFFNINKNNIILNNIKLILDEGISGLKLTGRAAEIARKKGNKTHG